MALSHPMNPVSPTPKADKPRGINWAIQRGKPRGMQIQRGKPQISKNKTTNYKLVPECSPIKEFGDKFSWG